MMVQDALDFMRARYDRQPAQFNRAVADWRPAGDIVVTALEMHEVLVRWRGVLSVFGEPDTRDLLRMWHDGRADHLGHDVLEFRPMRRAVKALVLVDLGVTGAVFVVALGVAHVDIGDAIHGVGSGDQPADLLDYAHHLAPQLKHFVRIHQPAEKEITLFGDAPLEFLRVVHRIV